MACKWLGAGVGLALIALSPATAQMSSTFNPNLVGGVMNPVVTNQCSGERCGKQPAAQQPRTASPENSRAICARARTITPKPAERARLAQLLALCEHGGY